MVTEKDLHQLENWTVLYVMKYSVNHALGFTPSKCWRRHTRWLITKRNLLHSAIHVRSLVKLQWPTATATNVMKICAYRVAIITRCKKLTLTHVLTTKLKIREEKTCASCKGNGFLVNAVSFCEDCDMELLCDTYAQHHQVQKVTKHHRLSYTMSDWNANDSQT